MPVIWLATTRRTFLAHGAAFLAAPAAAEAQATKVPRIGVLFSGAPATSSPTAAAFEQVECRAAWELELQRRG